ncbi:MAG: ABC transporter ATP-binding protein [Candidatus Dormibacteraeota bacterium]|nr:ABC transporter ATP-binding protein [Candidatus Dormibacteraeota bacterium]
MVARDLRVRRAGQYVLDGVSFALQRGAVIGLFGPSGCGKTTLMRSIVGVQRNVTGSLSVLGLPAGQPELRHRIAYTTQAPATYADLTVHENLEYFAAIIGAPAPRVAATIEHVGLSGLEHRTVASLSGGQQSRVSLGVALLADAEVLILDEPTVGLDPLLRIELWSLFRQLAGAGRTLLVSSHVLDEAAHCDLLVLMRDGRILATGAPADLCSRTGTTGIEDAFIALVRRGDRVNAS